MQFKKDSKKHDEDFTLLKVELEEANKIEEILKKNYQRRRKYVKPWKKR
jgi:hypothetical protein